MSACIVQFFFQDGNLILNISDKTLEGWVGRAKSDSTEISRKSITSHVARMTGGKCSKSQSF